MRWLVISLALHAVLVVWLARGHDDERLVAWRPPVLPAFERIETSTTIELLEDPAIAGGGGTAGTETAQASAVASRTAPSSAAASRSARVPTRSPDAWERISVQVERDTQAGESDGGLRGDGGNGGGVGGGVGGGRGRGIGFGEGGGVRIADDVPAPPPPPALSKARPAKLVWPTRDEEVDDDANLFVANVKVDVEGFVVGARMIKTRPGAKADRAADAIWTFRYAPALDDDGRPIQSTLEQPFQIR